MVPRLDFASTHFRSRDLGYPIDLEYTSTTPHVKHWKVHYVPLGDNRFGWIAQDITVQKELELVLRKNGEQLERAVAERTHDLEAALQVKSRFLAVVSHEVRSVAVSVVDRSLTSCARRSPECWVRWTC